jgi:hypothetical protein
MRDPEDLIQLAVSAGAVLGRMGGIWKQARPAVWTRQTCQDKDIRLRRAEKRLSPAERATVELPSNKERQKDVWDAVALGLWYLKRW